MCPHYGELVLAIIIVYFRTVDSIRKLVARKCEKKFVKNKIFMVLDLGKVKRYLSKLDAVEKNIEVRRNILSVSCS